MFSLEAWVWRVGCSAPLLEIPICVSGTFFLNTFALSPQETKKL